jgi:hypothetical protein
MRQTASPLRRGTAPMPGGALFQLLCMLLLWICCWATVVRGMTDEAIADLRYDMLLPRLK